MNDRRRGLGRGLGALIPSSPEQEEPEATPRRPVDVFFPAAGPAREAPQSPATSYGSLLGRSIDLRDQQPAAATTSGASDAPGAPAPVEEAVLAETGGAPGTDVDQGAGNQAASESEVVLVSVPPEPEPQGLAPKVSDEGLVDVPGAVFREVPLDAITPNPRQPRSVFDEDELAELAHSVREIGVLQPVVLRPLPGAAGRYELVMGERRWRASREAGLETIPAIIRDTPDDDLLRDALLENLHRTQLNPLEEAAAYDQLLQDFGCTHDELALRIGRSRPQISNTIRLLKLPPLVQRRVAAGVLSAGHARALLGLADAAAMERLAQRIVAEGLSVRATEEIVALGGDAERPAPRPRAAGPVDERLVTLASRLSDRFETRVKIVSGTRKGRLTVEFAGVEDLERILAVLAPDLPLEAEAD